ncbi:hypothetical protein QFC21_004431 [Naganishia friedmannii]|uniref:Uncharacterized protein n=1 Tax=Naganishia friedmannii TaxID=89922 RepID=A0ACC2VHR4_9TREE|nr:hypothetical protein QFC21_004431 [Naganishia friedmannii]
MSFAALKDKRNARRPRVPLAAGVGSISTSAFATAPTTAPVPIPTTGAAASAVLTTQPTTANAQGKKEQPQPLTESDSENLRYTDFPEEILQIRTTRQSGRGIYVRSDLGKDLTAGTTIIATSPTEAVLSTSQLEEYCSSCFLGVHELEFSPSRKVAAGAGGSKVVLFACGKRGKERPWIPEESVRALGRICWARRIRLRESKQTSEEDQWRQPFAQLAMTLAQYLAAGEASPGQEDELKAVDMRDFGFRGVGEMMDLVCARYAARMTEKGKGKGRLVDPRWCMFHPSCEKNGLIPLPINQEQGDLICPACGKSADIQLDKPASTAVVVHMSRNAETGLGPNLFPAIRVHSILVHALDAVLPVNHPSVGIALAELGKLLNVHVDDESASSAPGESQVDLGNGFLIPRGTSQRLPLALSTLRRAWETLQIGFGGERDVEGGVVAWEVKVLVEGLERELQLRRRA